MVITERYAPFVMGVNQSRTNESDHIGGFLCITTGTLTVEVVDLTGSYAMLINALPVTAGVYYPLPFYTSARGSRITTAGGASGVLAT